MKFSLFVHLENGEEPCSHSQLRREFIDLCRLAEEGGMHAIWTGEHHGMDFTISPNPFLTIADLAHHTRKIRLGTGTIVAPFWHPIRLAGEAAATDLITGGRLDLGIARGAYNFEYERLMPGLEAFEAGARMREMAPLLRRLWQGDCAHEGEFFRFPETTVMPRPVQKDGPPIWIAARDPDSHLFALKNGFNVQVTPLWQGIEEITVLMQRFESALATADVTRPKIMLLHHVYVGESEEDVERAAKELGRFYCYFGAWFANKRPVHQGRIAPLTQHEIEGNERMSPAAMRRDLTMGMPQEVIDRIKRFEDMGFDEFSFWIDSGMSAKRKRASLQRFIDRVMPAFQ